MRAYMLTLELIRTAIAALPIEMGSCIQSRTALKWPSPFPQQLMQGPSIVDRRPVQLKFATKKGTASKDAIDLDEKDPESERIDHSLECYFGKFVVHLEGGELRIDLHLKEQPHSLLQDDEIQLIERDQYELTQPIILRLTDSTLTDPLSRVFGSVAALARYLVQNVGNHRQVAVDSEKLTLNAHLRESQPELIAELYYNCFKELSKEELLRSLREINNNFNSVDMNFLDPDLLLLVSGFTEEELLGLYRDQDAEEDSSSSFSSSSDEEGEDEKDEGEARESEEHTSEQGQGEVKDNISFASQLEQGYQQFPPNQQGQLPRSTFKQNEIPIYERFRGVDINIPRKQKIKLAEKMLRIGYCKEQIIRFFGGGADEMEAEGNRVPDYRNPHSARYKEIHLSVAKKQHARHNQLLKRYSLPPVQELPEYAGELVTVEKRSRERRIKELLVRCVKEKRFKRLDEIRDEMRNHNEDVSLLELKRYIEELKKKTSEKKEQEKNRLSSEE